MGNYWKKRQQQLNSQLEKDEAQLKKKLSKYYDSEARKLEREIAAYYQQYGEKNVIEYRKLMESLPDADKTLLIERMDDFAIKYPEYQHLLPVRGSIYKLNRLEGLQQSILMQQLEMGEQDVEEIRKHLEKQFLRGANAIASDMGFGTQFYTNNRDIMDKVINRKWLKDKNFSDRIWGNRQKLADYLQTDFANAIARGDSYERCMRGLRQRFGRVSRRDAYRLIYTEGTYIMSEAMITPFEDEFEEYKFTIADDNACGICKPLNNKTFRIKDRRPGTNFAPMHSWCRCGFEIVEPEDWDAWIEERVRRHGDSQIKVFN